MGTLIGVGMKSLNTTLFIRVALAVLAVCAAGVAQQGPEPQQRADPDFKASVERPA
jgi:hypothetical protein